MVTIQQYVKGARGGKRRKKKCPKLLGNPQRRAICIKVNHQHKPKKPNSAKRKTATVIFKNKKRAMCCIPGQGHNVSVNMELLIRGGRKPDLPGVKYHIMRNKLDFHGKEVFIRRRKRSKYGLKNLRKSQEYVEKVEKEVAEGKHPGVEIIKTEQQLADHLLRLIDEQGPKVYGHSYSEESIEYLYTRSSKQYRQEKIDKENKKINDLEARKESIENAMAKYKEMGKEKEEEAIVISNMLYAIERIKEEQETIRVIIKYLQAKKEKVDEEREKYAIIPQEEEDLNE